MDSVFLLVRVDSTILASTLKLFTTSPSTRTKILLVDILICAKLLLSHHFVRLLAILAANMSHSR